MEPQLLTQPRNVTLAFFTLLSLFFASQSQAYPEMIRYGYVNCNSCHVNLNGGGVLTDYGREISREENAIWKSKDEKSKEHLSAYGILDETPIQKYLKIGADARAIYLIENTAQATTGTTYFMQGDLEAAFIKDHFTLVGTAGVEEPIPSKNPTLSFVSRRHYVQYAINDNWNLRAGRFVPAYGINSADHDLLTRSRLLLGYGLETDNFEISRISEQWTFFLTGILGRTLNMFNQPYYLDSGFSAQATYAPTEKMKVGLNAWYGKNDLNVKRWILGGFALLGITSDLVVETELDFPMVNQTNSNGFASTQKASYQLTEGLWPYLIQEYAKSNFKIQNSQSDRYGMGMQIFPRTHFEFDLLYEKRRDGGAASSFIDYAYLMSHFYL